MGLGSKRVGSQVSLTQTETAKRRSKFRSNSGAVSGAPTAKFLAPLYRDFGAAHFLPARLRSSGVYSELLKPLYHIFDTAHSPPAQFHSSGNYFVVLVPLHHDFGAAIFSCVASLFWHLF